MPPLYDDPRCRCYMGIDPGVGGGIAVVRGDDVVLAKMPESRTDLLDLLLGAFGGEARPCFAVVEQQAPRPTNVFDKSSGQWRATILKSTCLLWGNYERVLTCLTCLNIPHDTPPPKRWQSALGIPDKAKGEDRTRWKNRLKAKAQQLFPRAGVTLATCDALLLAEFCRRWREGRADKEVR